MQVTKKVIVNFEHECEKDNLINSLDEKTKELKNYLKVERDCWYLDIPVYALRNIASRSEGNYYLLQLVAACL